MVKSSRMRTLSFGDCGMLAGRARRESAMIEVMAGLERHWRRVTWPMKPVTPVRMTFIVALVDIDSRGCCNDA